MSAPYAHIKLIAADSENGDAYLDIAFYRGRDDWRRGADPFLLNDFVMQLRTQGHRRGDTGLWIPERRDAVAECYANVDRYLRRAQRKGFFGDHRIGHGGWFCSLERGWRYQGTENARRPIELDRFGVLAVLRKAFSREVVTV